MPTQPLLSWAQPVSAGNVHTEFGAIEEVDLSIHPNEIQGAIKLLSIILNHRALWLTGDHTHS